MLLQIDLPFGNSQMGKISLNLPEYFLIQYTQSFTDRCMHVDHVYRTRKNQKDIHFSNGRITSLCVELIYLLVCLLYIMKQKLDEFDFSNCSIEGHNHNSP